ncbi:MAG: ribose-5-phosphate isomerase RpiA [ANME-2 cluster archaeon]|nr:ribose-5-phosphate isomerase RpiA [ANME-2 cluster archaeon]
MDRTELTNTDEKKAVGYSAAALVEDGMVVGLGTGSTTAFAIEALGRRVDEGLDIKGIPTSYQSQMLAIEWGIPLTSLDQDPVLDIALDGADQVDVDLFVIKGGGAAHTNEKIVARSSRQFVVLVDEKKMVDTFTYPVPLEVIPRALELVKRQVMALGGSPLLRMAVRKDGPVITDNGNLVVDVDFGEIPDPRKLAMELSVCTGIIEHGIFDNVDEVYVGKRDGSIEIIKCKR